MKLRELIKIAKERSSIFDDYQDIEVEDLLFSFSNKSKKYNVNIASGTIISKYGTKCGYIDYSTELEKVPEEGEVILMHNKYVGKIDKIEFCKYGYDATIWIKTAYEQDNPNLDFEMKHPTFNAGTY